MAGPAGHTKVTPGDQVQRGHRITALEWAQGAELRAMAASVAIQAREVGAATPASQLPTPV